ncbi:uncharacterized protein LOC110097371 [Dendrobium catenatum]|uniref:Synechocystis YCF37 n=1 Tax=Dendrobium catenatum TaxID=906689 RepID=A0A2I0VUP2_9ASPA|nr:uncharacterized protein LOC110097371 [Dendrobium catenatum]PKU67142.1 hypothetical protein MA16_Dca013003 [Dendrobium catenatum]
MASASAPLVLHMSPIRRHSSTICSQSEHPLIPTRRLVLSSPAIFLMLSSTAKAEDIPLFGLRKKLKNLEEDAVEVVKEGEKVVEEGIAAAEKEVVAAEEEIVAAAAGVGVFGDLAQAGVVAGAEVVGVLIGLSVVNGILEPEVR